MKTFLKTLVVGTVPVFTVGAAMQIDISASDGRPMNEPASQPSTQPSVQPNPVPPFPPAQPPTAVEGERG
jgi:hypothetical protein